MINRENYQLPPKEGFILTHFLTVADVKRSAEFYVHVLGGTVVRKIGICDSARPGYARAVGNCAGGCRAKFAGSVVGN